MLSRHTVLCLLATATMAGCYPDAEHIRRQGTAQAGMGGAGLGGAAQAGSVGSAGAGGAGGAVNPARPCTEYAEALCARLGSCWPAGLKLSFGDEARCRQRVKLNCDLTDLPGSNWPSRECVQAFSSFDCTEFNNGLDPMVCGAPGRLADDAACADETQCQGRRCLVAQGSSCGRCASKQPEGSQCLSDASCARGLVCSDGSKTCVKPGGSGADCGAARPCQDVLLCRAGKCAAPGVDGTTCAGAADCDGFAGFGCNNGIGKCVLFTVTATSCMTRPDGTFELCEARGTCNANTRMCTRAAMEGQACNDTSGPRCLFPAACAGNQCRLPMLRTACPAAAAVPWSGSSRELAATRLARSRPSESRW